jgi:hypothetical protein
MRTRIMTDKVRRENAVILACLLLLSGKSPGESI